MPSATKEFIQLLVGFTDAECSFYIYNNKGWTAASLRFSIELYADDIGVLYKIAQTLGVGRLVKDKIGHSAVFYVVNLDDMIRVIIPLFQEFPLQTSKYLDFTFFSKAALIKSKSPEGVSKISKTDIMDIKKLKERMNSKRLTIDKKQEDFLSNKVSMNTWWFLGFVEGEGTFGYKHLVPYFLMAPHKKKSLCFNCYINFFVLSNIFKESTNTLDCEEFNVKYKWNMITGVYSITLERIYLIFFLLYCTFIWIHVIFTRKSVDYH